MVITNAAEGWAASPSAVERIAAAYNPFVGEQLEGPYPMYRRARRDAPVFWSPVLNMWVITRYDDVLAALKNPADFASHEMLKNLYEHTPAALEVLKVGGYARIPLTIDNDTPSHGRIRGAVSKAFTPRRATMLEPAIRATVNELLDQAVAVGKIDIIEEFAAQIPLRTILRLLGVPLEDMANMRRWGDSWGAFLWAPLTPEQQIACARDMVEYLRYCERFVEERRRSPQDDLMSDLLRVTEEGGKAALTTEELAYMLNDLIFAGHEAVLNSIGNAVNLLLGRPDWWATLRERPEALPAAVEELLRLDAPSQCVMRTTTREVQVVGVTLPAGVRVCLVLGSANHDETVFSNPEELDLQRKNLERHLSFGQGPHYCLAAGLGRVQLRIALEVLSKRLKNPRLVPGQTLAHKPNLIFRTLARLETTWDEITPAA